MENPGIEAWDRIMPWLLGAVALLLIGLHLFARGDGVDATIVACAIILWVASVRT